MPEACLRHDAGMTPVGCANLHSNVTPAQAGAHACAPQRCGCGRDRHAFQVANRLMAHLRFEVAWVPASAGMTFFGRAQFTMRSDRRRAALIPAALARCGILRLPLSATGRGWAHSPSSWQRAAPGRRAEWLEIREARWQPFPARRQQWRRTGDRPSGSRCDGARPGNGQRAPEAKVVPRDKNRRRGCRKATPGP